VEDFIIDSESWRIRYLVIDTVNFWPSKSVMIAPEWVASARSELGIVPNSIQKLFWAAGLLERNLQSLWGEWWQSGLIGSARWETMEVAALISQAHISHNFQKFRSEPCI